MSRLLLKLILLSLLLSWPSLTMAQSGYTVVTATVKDANGSLYVNAPYTVTFFDPGTSGILPTLNNSPFQRSYNGIATSASGVLSITLPDNGVIASTSGATGTQWTFSICSAFYTSPNTNYCIPAVTLTITGATQNISTALTAVAPLLPLSGAGSGTVTQVNTTGPITGGPFNVTGTVACPTCVIDPLSLTSGLPVVGNGGQTVTTGTRTGNTTEYATFNGTATPIRCVDTDANGNLQVTGADCGAGGGGSPGAPTGSYQFNQGGSFVGSAAMLDCSSFGGGDPGAKINACISSAATGAWVNISNLSGTITTAITISKPLTIYCQGSAFNLSNGISFTGNNATIGGLISNPCAFTKTFNGDMITFNGGSSVSGDVVTGIKLIGNGASFTGNCIVATNGATNYVISYNNISGCVSAEIIVTGNSVFNPAILGTIASNTIVDNGSAAIEMVSGAWLVQNNSITDSNSPTSPSGAAIQCLIANACLMSGNAIRLTTALTRGVYCGAGGSGIIQYTTGIFTVTGNAAAFDVSGCSNIDIENNPIITGGGGGGGAAINATLASGVVNISGNGAINLATPGNNTIQVALVQGSIVANNVSITLPTATVSGECGISLTGNSLGGIIKNNGIQVTGGNTATGRNYGICIVPVASGGDHMNGNIIENNVITGQTNTDDFGIFFNNVAGSNASFERDNRIISNECVDCGTFITDNDSSQNAVNVYANNIDVATTNFYDAGGSTNRVLFEIMTPNAFTFATLPVAGIGSIVYCSDCSYGTALTGSASGVMLVKNAVGWVGIGNGPICTNVSPVTVSANTTAAQTLMECNIPLGILKVVNSNLRIHFKGVYSTPVASVATLTFVVRLYNATCGVGPSVTKTLFTITTGANAGNVTNDPFIIDVDSTTQTAGSSAAFEASGEAKVDIGALPGTAMTVYGDPNTATIGAIDATSTLCLSTSIAFSAGSASNTATARQLVLEIE